jgi:NAD(P)-dependent dehydrogenase (short-subunit alcohol dehydrogenase family)
VRDPDQVQAVVGRTVADFGRVDVLVNNAGTVWGAPPEEMPLEGWQKVVDVNLTGVFLFSQAAGRAMISNGGGSIVNIASVAGLHGSPTQITNSVVYHATKGGVIAFSRDLACKWAEHGIRVNAIAPGWVASDMGERMGKALGEENMLAAIPLRRAGTPAEIGKLAVYLASSDASWITGKIYRIDGGAFM